MASTLPTPGTTYYLINKESTKVLDVADHSKIDGGNVQQWTKNQGENQKWLLQDAGDGSFFLINKESTKALDVADHSKIDGGNVQQWTKSQGENQKWLLQDAGDGSFFLINKESTKALDVADHSKIDGGNVQQWTKSQGENQKWIFEAVTSASTTQSQPFSLPPISDKGIITTEAGKTYNIQVTVDIPADIGYDNSFGIFAMNDDGSVAGVKPGTPDYAATVVKNRVLSAEVDKGSYKKGQTFKYDLPGGRKYGVFLITNGTPDQFLVKNPTNQGSEPPLAYFFDIAANPDQKSHVKVLPPNQYGFEDTYGGGDQDFNDLIVKLETVSV